MIIYTRSLTLFQIAQHLPFFLTATMLYLLLSQPHWRYKVLHQTRASVLASIKLDVTRLPMEKTRVTCTLLAVLRVR